MPPKAKPSDDCQITLDTAARNETNYTVHCAKRKETSTARFAYAGDHFNGTLTIKTEDGEVQQIYTAVRLGACDDMPDVSEIPPAK